VPEGSASRWIGLKGCVKRGCSGLERDQEKHVPAKAGMESGFPAKSRDQQGS
jgi:hypothetical protein